MKRGILKPLGFPKEVGAAPQNDGCLRTALEAFRGPPLDPPEVTGVTAGNYDVLIVGGGITGATLARELSAFDLRVAVLDKAGDLPSGASRANSGMLHAGYDDKPGTVKARFCAPGNKRYRELHEMLDFTLRPCGSYVCAFSEADCRHLEKLKDQGARNGVPGLDIVPGDVLRSREPHVSPHIVAALHAPTGSVVNNFEAVLAFLDNAQQNGVELFLDTEVKRVLLTEGGGEILGVETSRGRFLAPVIVNAAGTHSGEIAALAGDESIHIRPTRGEYFITDKAIGRMIQSFFFPCPDERGKGITVAPTADFNLLLGPTSVGQDDKDGTATTRRGLAEVMEGALRLVPSIPQELTITSFAGVRAADSTEDFRIGVLARPRGFVNMAGIKSPGLTSAPALALHVVELLREELADRILMKSNPHFIPERTHILRFAALTMEERQDLVRQNPAYAQIVCRCETVTEAQIVEAVRRGARTVAGVKMWTRAGSGRCQGGFCCPRVVDILARELDMDPDEVTRHGGPSRLMVGHTKAFGQKKGAHHA